MAESELWVPAGAALGGDEPILSGLIVIMGPSGVGKSWLIRQMAMDEWFVRRGIYVMMAEDGTMSYGREALKRIHKEPGSIGTVENTYKKVKEFHAAHKAGKRLPWLLFWDSVSGGMDYSRRYYEEHPKMVWSKEQKAEVRDKRQEFGERGYGAMDTLVLMRDLENVWSIAFVTTHEGSFSPVPELAVEGGLLPKNLARLSSLCLYMRSREVQYDPEQTTVKPAPHRTISVNEKGEPMGKYIDRFFTTQNTGEVVAKGHSSLALEERAILPVVLRKVMEVKEEEVSGGTT